MSTPRRRDRPLVEAHGAASPVHIHLLGQFAVVRSDGQEAPAREFGGRLARRLLRMLALRRGTLLSKDVAIEALWPAHPPADAPGNVEILVSRIRRALGDRSLVQTGPGGYTLVGDGRCRVDVEEFLTAAMGGQAKAAGDPVAALAAFQRALALWHGDPLAEDAYADWAQEHRRHLWRVRLDALEGAATAALALGDPLAATTWARAACEQEPLREAAAMLLVHALAASADRAAALVTFDAFGRRLAEEIGIEPSAQARQLRQRVLCDQIRTANAAAGPVPVAANRAREPAAADARSAVRAQVAALPPAQAETLSMLALMGRHTAPGALALAADRGLRDILDALDALGRAGLAEASQEGWAIAPGPAARIATERLGPGRRTRIHLLLAQALRRNAADCAEVAAHLVAGGDRQAAAAAFADAANASLDHLADQEALPLTQAGLALSSCGGTRAALLETRGEAHRRLGELSEARADLEGALQEVPHGPGRSRVLARLAILETRSRDANRGGELIELAIAEAGGDLAARGQALAAGAIIDLTLDRPDRAQRRFEQAHRLLEQAGDTDGTTRLLYWRGMARLIAGRIAEAITELDGLAHLPVTPDELLRLWDPRAARGHALVFAAEPAAGLAEIDQALAWAQSVGHPAMRCACLWHRSEALSALARPAEATESAQAAFEIAAQIGHAEWSAAALRGLGIARQAAGDLAGAEAAFQRSLRAARANPLFAAWASARLGLVLVRQGRPAEAEPLIASTLAHGAPLTRHEARWARAELAHAQGDPAAPRVADAALKAARRSGYLALAPRLAELAGC